MTTRTRATHPKRAIALLTTMASVVVIIMLVGAFLATRQSLIAMTRLSTEQQACQDALRSLAVFCRFQMEGQEHWGRVPGRPDDQVEFQQAGKTVFVLTPLSAPQAQGDPNFSGLPGRAYFAGKGSLPDITFQIGVSNNLEGKVESGGIPPKTCRLALRARLGETVETVEVTVRRAAFFDSTVAASGEIQIRSDSIRFSSSDPLRNQIRSQGEIRLPPIRDIEFVPHPDVQTPEKGTVWSKDEILIDDVFSEDLLREAAEETGGEFLPKAPTRYSVPQLRKRDFEPDETTSPKPILKLPPVAYRGSTVAISYQDETGKEWERKIPALLICEPDRDGVTGQILEFHFSEAALLEPLEPDEPLDHTPDPNTVVMKTGPAESDVMMGVPSESGTVGIEGGAATLPATSEQGLAFEFAAEQDYRVEGSFQIWSVDLPPASVLFKDNDPDPEHPEEGLLSVDQDLVIEGYLSNCGRLLAGRDVSLIPVDVAIGDLEKTRNVAVLAGRDVLIHPLESGYTNDSNRFFAFKGLVYAENNFSFLSSRNTITPEKVTNRRLYVEGALVARRGEVQIYGSESVELKYNREYLDDLLERSFEDNMVQLEEISWRPL